MGKKTTSTEPPVGGDVIPYIKLKLVGDDRDVHFRVKYTVKMGTLKKHFAERTGFKLADVSFLYKKREVEDHETPESLQMVDNDSMNFSISKNVLGTRSTTDQASENSDTLLELVDDEEMIMLELVDADPNEIRMEVRYNATLNSMKKGYAACKGIDVSTISFYFGELLIRDEDTPSSLDLEDYDVIRVVSVSQTQNIDVATTSDPVDTPDTYFVRVKMVDYLFDEVDFYVDSQTSMEKLIKDYAECKGLDLATLRFMFNCREIKATDTPESLKMVDDDAIDVFED